MKYIDADKLIAEIERKRDSALERQKNLEKIGQETVLNEMIAFELNRLISFINSLQQEQPVDGLEEKDFVEEVRQYYSNNCTWDALKQPMLSIITMCARHFAEWQYQKDRGEFAKLKAKEWSDGYNEGIARGKEKMLEDAVEGVARPDDCEIWVNLVGYGYKFKDGDKVKVIVIKED